MMGSPPVRACLRRWSPCARANRARSWWRFRSHRATRAVRWLERSMTSFASQCRVRFAGSAHGMKIFGKSPTTRCAVICSVRAMPPEVSVESGGVRLCATLTETPQARGVVIFAHGSGSSRHSTRNIYVAEQLNARGFSTLLLDLLTPAEDRIDRETAQLRFAIDLLARRVEGASAWAERQSRLTTLPQGYFGASTGAAAALVAASMRSSVRAVVSRGGRPDLAGAHLPNVEAATLLLV